MRISERKIRKLSDAQFAEYMRRFRIKCHGTEAKCRFDISGLAPDDPMPGCALGLEYHEVPGERGKQ